jgi:tetratricopeptide (TPR) repeat protein
VGPGIAARPGTGTLPGLGNRPGNGLGDRLGADRPQSLEDRRQGLQDRLSSREDNVADRREDWQDRYDHFYDHHGDWHHGCWHGNWSNWWSHMWDEHTAFMAFRTTVWGLNWASYAFGYSSYSNPYYTEPVTVATNVTVDYSQPLVETAPAAEPTDPAAPQPGISDFDAARQAFYDGDYARAMESTNKALAQLPKDPVIHEFRALVLFAQGQYQPAAAALYSVLSVGPGWDWTTLSSLYPSTEVYTKQLRALEAAVKQKPDDPALRFVVAYHYLTMGSKDAAAEQLKALLALSPQDKVAKDLLAMVAGPEAVPGPKTPPPPEAGTGAAVSAEQLVGNWQATGPDQKSFALSLTKEGAFTWTYSQGSTKQSVQGAYAVDGTTLAMEVTGGGTMLAGVTPPAQGSFRFQMLGGPAGDPGLTFRKAE